MSNQRQLRLGMIGDGQGAYIGDIHRLASRLDSEWRLVAGKGGGSRTVLARTDASLFQRRVQ
jgi:hypothetical protein